MSRALESEVLGIGSPACTPATVESGTKTNVVPAFFRVTVDRRATLDEDIEAAEREFRAVVSDIVLPDGVSTRVDVNLRAHPFRSDLGEPQIQASQGNVEEISGTTASVRGSRGLSDARFFVHHGTKTARHGPGEDESNIHDADENDKIRQIRDADHDVDHRVGVQPAAGANDINLAELTVQYVSNDDFANLVVGNDSDTTNVQATGDTNPDNIALTDNSESNYLVDVITAENEDDVVMTDNADRYEIVVPLADAAVDSGEIDGTGFDQGNLAALDKGEAVELTLTTDVGAQTVAFLQVPDSLSGDQAGSTVNL